MTLRPGLGCGSHLPQHPADRRSYGPTAAGTTNKNLKTSINMNKLLLTLTVLACAMGSHAQDAGDFVYTKDGRFKITDGVNMLQNGDFGQGTQHWTTDGQTPLNPDTFYVDNLGPDGSPCLVANKKDNGPGTGCSLMQKVEVKQGRTYYITYSVAAGEEVTTTTTGGSGVKNYQNIFFNTDGSATPQQPIATSKSYGLDWTKIEYSFTAPENGYVVFHFYGSYVGTTFDDFKVMAANKAVDDREANAIIESLNGYLSNPLLPNGHDILEGFIGDLKLYVEQNDLDSYNGMLGFLDECVALFLDENSVNITGHVKCPDFDETSVSLDKDVTNVGGPDGWQAWGGRWTQRDITAPFTSIWMKREIDGKYILEQGGLYQVMENMPAGQYMFSLKVRAAKYKNKNNDIDYDCDLRGLKIFINEDSVEMHPIHTERLTTYSAFHKLDQPGTVTIGIYIPDSVCNRVDLDNTDLRIIGATQEDIDDYFAQRETQAARQQLAEAIGTAGQLLGSELYLYGKDNLRDSIAAAQQAHDTAADTETLVAAKADLDSAMTHFKDINKAYTALAGDIANAEAQLSDPAYTEGRDALHKAISQAKAFAEGLTTEHSEETDLAIAEQGKALKEAVNGFVVANIHADEKYIWLSWAQKEGASYTPTPDWGNPLTTSSGATMYAETALFAGNDLSGRIAFSEKAQPALDPNHGLSVGYPSKNSTVMSVLNLKEGDQVTIDYSMGNSGHSVYVTSANAWYYDAAGNKKQLESGGKVGANQLDNSLNADGLGGKARYTFNMTADGTLDIYLGSSASTMRISYIGITYAENVVDAISEIMTGDNADGRIYNLNGQFVGTQAAGLPKGIYICNGRKFAVK